MRQLAAAQMPISARSASFSGEPIRVRRLELGLTQKQAAERAHMAQAHFSRLELNQCSASVLTFAQVALALELEPAELYRRCVQVRP